MPTINSWNSELPAQVAVGGSGLTTITDHAVMVGSGTGAVTPIAMNTNGMVLIGSSGADPVAATITAGTNISVTNGAGTISIAATGSALGLTVVRQVFTSNGTYTPTVGMRYCDVEVIGGGGGGGGSAAAADAKIAAAGGGGAGGYARKICSAATIGASQTVTVGALGAGGAAGNNPGSAGSTTSLGAIVTAAGGSGGTGSAAVASVVNMVAGGAGGTGASGDFNTIGQTGGDGICWDTGLKYAIGGCGGSSFISYSGARSKYLSAVGGGIAGNAASGYGGGGGGAILISGAGGDVAAAGGDGCAGIVIITEYL